MLTATIDKSNQDTQPNGIKAVLVRYSTPTYKFTANVDLVEYTDKFRVVFTQLGREVLYKTEDDVTFDGMTAQLKLTQEETALFYANQTIEMSIRFKFKSGEVPPEKVFLLLCKDANNQEVL